MTDTTPEQTATTPAPPEPVPSAPTTPAPPTPPVEVDDESMLQIPAVITRLEAEIGKLFVRTVLDDLQAKTAAESWKSKEEQYKMQLIQLSVKVTELEARLPQAE